MADWYTLPPKICNLILECLCEDQKVARYAAVSREFRRVIGRKTFSRLQLNQYSLGFLRRLTKYSKSLVRHICFDVDLATYNCSSCRLMEDFLWREENDKDIEGAIRQLFCVLSLFPRNQDEGRGQGGLTLELNCYSPSDKHHFFQDCYFGVLGEKVLPGYVHDVPHGYHRGTVSRISCVGLRRPFEKAYLACLPTLHPIPAVTKFILRRQCRRQLHPSKLSYMWSRLPQLQEISYEPWHLNTEESQDEWDEAYNTILHEGLPESVKTVTIFEDFNAHNLNIIRNCQGLGAVPNPDRLRNWARELGASFAKESQKLENLSVAFLLDASDFFDACDKAPDWQWPALRSLTLTSRSLTTNELDSSNKLMQAAARAALRMPALQTMTVWNGAIREAFAFTWTREGARLFLRGTWNIQPNHDTIVAWRKVADTYSFRHVFKMSTELFFKRICSHADAVVELGLGHVVDGVSLQQIRLENRSSPFIDPDFDEGIGAWHGQ